MAPPPPPSLTLIVAATTTNGIGQAGRLPWRLSQEMAYFEKVTTSAGITDGSTQMNALIMGRKTWDSIPTKFRPLKGRINVVVSRQDQLDGLSTAPDTYLAHSLTEAISLLTSRPIPPLRTFIIGGAQLYTEALALPTAARLLLTRIKSPAFDCDTFLPPLGPDQGWSQANAAAFAEWTGFDVARGDQVEKGVTYEFQMWERQTP